MERRRRKGEEKHRNVKRELKVKQVHNWVRSSVEEKEKKKKKQQEREALIVIIQVFDWHTNTWKENTEEANEWVSEWVNVHVSVYVYPT